MPRNGGKRMCGTPGCSLPDFHPGMCESDAPSGKRESAPVLPPPPPPPPSRPVVRRPRQPKKRPAATKRPAEQRVESNGLHRFYHVHRWGVPLPDGPVECGAGSDEDVDESWRLEESTRRTRARTDVGPNEATLTGLWNEHVKTLPPLVSDRMLPGACRQFARAHAAALAAELRGAFAAHLAVMWEHNLLHRDDVEDCVLLVDALAAQAEGAGTSRGSVPSVALLCAECSRPLHEERCATYGRARGAAAWPLQQTVVTDG